MAYRSIYFPSSTTGWQSPVGSIRVKFYYVYSSELSVNDDAPIIKIQPIEIPLEADPSDQTFRFDSMKITFGYSSIFDNDAVMRYAPNATWMDIYIDGSLYWKGLVNFDKMKKYDWFVNTSGTLQWQKVDLEIYGCFAYFWWNNVTLADCGYTLGDTIESTLQNICAEIGISSGDVVIDSNLKIAVDYGSTEYDITDLHVGCIATKKVSDFLKAFILEFAIFMYFIDGKAYFVFRNGGATLSITNSDIIEVEKGINDNLIEYVYLKSAKLKGDTIFDHPDDGDIIPLTSFDAIFYHGTESVDENRNFIIYETSVMDVIYTVATGATHYPTSYSANTAIKAGSTDEQIVANGTYIDLETNLIEDGDVIFYNGGYSTNPFETGSMVKEVVNAYTVKFFDTDVEADVDDNFDILRGTDSDRYRFKHYKLAELAEGVYNDYFLTSKDIIKIKLYDVSAFDDLSSRYVFASGNYRAKKAKIDLIEDSIYLELVKVT